ncbi:MAG: hypothetical protein QOF76_2702 [Solirubrobacteraceae bacterium]|nr:hypothetical protein [Solirubrobacteraceae bacterium]
MTTLAQPLPRTGLVAACSAIAGAVALLAAIGAVHLANAGHKSSGSARVFAAPGFQIAVPDGWSALRGETLARVPGSPAAVLRRADGHGVVIVRRTGALSGDLRKVAGGLTARLKATVPGFRLVSARLGSVRAGGAFLYTFVTGSSAESLAVTRIGGTTYRIDSVVPAGSADAARQAGAIAASFGP